MERLVTVGKFVTLKFGEGSFEQGFSVTLQVGSEHVRPSTEITGKLPPDPELLQFYSRWQSIYTRLIASGLIPGRPLCLPKQTQPAVTLVDCQQAAQALSDRLNAWLRADSFYPIWTTWQAKLQPTDELRVLLQTTDSDLQKLPWHLWSLLVQYPKAEIALSAFDYDSISPVSPPANDAKILAILGSNEGIDIASDRQILDQIAGQAVHFLLEPQLKDLTDELWQQPWRMMFFAGHSATQENGKIGRIAISPTESLSIGELRYALRAAVQRGLQLAIFNSCDGLGLARELIDLHIPQIIVMREPVPDYVAQEFLKYFLEAFARNMPLYQAVREARERLQGLENRFPCATWLPVIYQNPAVVPLTWQELMKTGTQMLPQRRQRSRVRDLLQVAGISVVVTACIALGRYIGLLQPLELQAFDQLMRLRPQELPDPRLLVIMVDEEAIQSLERDRGSLSDKALNQLLAKLEQGTFQPRVIGLDIYRDFPAKLPVLAQRLQQAPHLVAVCRVGDATNQNLLGIKPPPEVPRDRLGFSDFVEDPDSVIRRQLLFMDADPASPCPASDAFSFQLALRYLRIEGIQPQDLPDNSVQLGNIILPRLQLHTGAYHAADTLGSQILLNYRQAPFDQVSLLQVLSGTVDPSAWKDRIVLIGVTAGNKDYLPTPYGQRSIDKLHGVIVHAHMISQILSAVKDQRSLLWTWSQGLEIIWIGSWSFVGGLLVWLVWRSRSPVIFNQRPFPTSTLLVLTTCGIVVICCQVTLNRGGWIPLVPPVLAIAATGAIVGFSQNLPQASTNQR